jgi:hypothetical protein
MTVGDYLGESVVTHSLLGNAASIAQRQLYWKLNDSANFLTYTPSGGEPELSAASGRWRTRSR